MKKILPDGRYRSAFSLLGVCLLIGIVLSYSEQVSSHNLLPQNQVIGGQSMMDLSAGEGIWSVVGKAPTERQDSDTGTLEKMIVESGSVTLDVDLSRLNGFSTTRGQSTLRFTSVPDAFFTVLVFNNEFRGPLPSSMALVPQDTAALPKALRASFRNLVVESSPWGGQYDLVVRDGRSGFVYFNIEGEQWNYDAAGRVLSVQDGRLLVSEEFANQLGRPALSGSIVGSMGVSANMRAIEVSQIVAGDVKSDVLPAERPDAGTVPGPDVIVGDLSGLAQFGSSSGTRVGLSVGTDSCNLGTVDLHWLANPTNDHPVIPQNLYRMSGGATNNDRFEQVGQSSVKHAFTALTNNICSLGCNGVGGTALGSGCSDPYSASLNSGPNLGSRAWINPFTGAYPRNDGATPNNDHNGHVHTGPSHRILTEIADLTPSNNPGATYYAESQYVTPHEYVWCQANPTQCNMNNNVSYRQYSVTNSASPFSFSPVAATQRQKTAVSAWTGATLVNFQPSPLTDGVGTVAYKVTNPSPGVWHYEYAIYNQNLDRAISSFTIPIGTGVAMTNVGFHAPPQQPGWSADGTVGNTGYSSTPWTQSEAGGWMTWSSETLAQNPNANAVRWGTLYNIRFDSDKGPMLTSATIGFLKTGSPITVRVLVPANAIPTCSRLPTGNRCA
ncbi:hypothetical protein BH10ACI3_BH10ACI3_13590 [soil metagenome]